MPEGSRGFYGRFKGEKKVGGGPVKSINTLVDLSGSSIRPLRGRKTIVPTFANTCQGLCFVIHS
jgi:hypothetical protein